MTEVWIERLPFIVLTDRDRDVKEEGHRLLPKDVTLTRAFLALPLTARATIVGHVAPVMATHPCEGCRRALERAVAP